MEAREGQRSRTPDYLNGEGQEKRRDWWKIIRLFVYLAAGFAGAFLLYHTFGLYQITFTKWGLGNMASSCGAFAAIPFLGGWVRGGCQNLAGVVVGLIALATLIGLTILELIPVFLYFHRTSIEDMVDQLRHNKAQNRAISEEQTDTKEVSTLIKRHRKLGEGALKTFLILSIVAFALEAYIIWVARNGRASVLWVIIESCGLWLLVVGVLMFRNVFIPKPERNAVRYQG